MSRGFRYVESVNIIWSHSATHMILLSVAADTCRDALQSPIKDNGNIVLQGNPMAVGLDRQDNESMDHNAAWITC